MSEQTNNATASIADAIALAVSTYFEEKGSKQEVYSTADGFIFENVGFATNHATTLDDKNVTPHTKASNLQVVDEKEVTGDEYLLTDADKELLQSGLESKNYNAIKALAKNLKIDTPDQKAETLITALTAYKDSL